MIATLACDLVVGPGKRLSCELSLECCQLVVVVVVVWCGWRVLACASRMPESSTSSQMAMHTTSLTASAAYRANASGCMGVAKAQVRDTWGATQVGCIPRYLEDRSTPAGSQMRWVN